MFAHFESSQPSTCHNRFLCFLFSEIKEMTNVYDLLERCISDIQGGFLLLGNRLSALGPMTVAAEMWVGLNPSERENLILDVRKFRSQPFSLLCCGVTDFIDSLARRMRSSRAHNESAEVDFSVACQVAFNFFKENPHAEKLGQRTNIYVLLEFYESGLGTSCQRVIRQILENYETIGHLVPADEIHTRMTHALFMLDDVDWDVYDRVWRIQWKTGSVNDKIMDNINIIRDENSHLYGKLRDGKRLRTLPTLTIGDGVQYYGWRGTLADFDLCIKERMMTRLFSSVFFIKRFMETWTNIKTRYYRRENSSENASG